MAIRRGFTFVEVMIVIALTGLLLGVGLPGLANLMQQGRITAVTNEFSNALNLARTESVRRGVPVSICPAANTNLNSCGTAANWNNGWLVFVDADGNGAIAAATDRLSVRNALGGSATINTNQAVITYTGPGVLTAGIGVYTLATDDCTNNNARTVTINSAGRVSIAETVCPP